jgi:hypothetical protein
VQNGEELNLIYPLMTGGTYGNNQVNGLIVVVKKDNMS